GPAEAYRRVRRRTAPRFGCSGVRASAVSPGPRAVPLGGWDGARGARGPARGGLWERPSVRHGCRGRPDRGVRHERGGAGELGRRVARPRQADACHAGGRLVRRVGGTPGKGPDALDAPGGVTARGDTVYVADFYNHRVQAFSPSG